MHEITMPKLNNNDTSYLLVEWLCADGDPVAAGAPVVLVETSKAAEELVAEHDGVVRHGAQPGTEWPVGAVIGRLLSPGADPPPPMVEPNASDRPDRVEPVLTDAARAAVAAFGVTTDELRSIGRQLLRRPDIERVVAARTGQTTAGEATVGPRGADRYALSGVQQAVARAVSLANLEIPTAFAVVKVYTDAALDLLHELVVRHDRFLGLADLLVKALASVHEKFPLFFGSLRAGYSVALADRAHVGVTVDVGSGLFVPVVRDPAALSVLAVADALLDFRAKAMRAAFAAHELSGGNITLSLHTEPDVVLANPIVHPGQTAVLCLCANQEELYRDEQGGIGTRRYVNLGLGYDHRVINGRDAVSFLRELKARCEQPGDAAAPAEWLVGGDD
ncbi:MAG TPA: 2-oxo acid dehydrogenase subunit E2 [Pseudonocardiaceae bacterium]|nr:2-oxo acid dehydrogenase subunit E2 [Pseudonocardiaceae bacterium]